MKKHIKKINKANKKQKMFKRKIYALAVTKSPACLDAEQAVKDKQKEIADLQAANKDMDKAVIEAQKNIAAEFKTTGPTVDQKGCNDSCAKIKNKAQRDACIKACIAKNDRKNRKQVEDEVIKLAKINKQIAEISTKSSRSPSEDQQLSKLQNQFNSEIKKFRDDFVGKKPCPVQHPAKFYGYLNDLLAANRNFLANQIRIKNANAQLKDLQNAAKKACG